MMRTTNKRRYFLATAMQAVLLPLAACMEVRPGSPDPLRSEVQQLVAGLERGLRAGGWQSVENYYSEDYRGNLGDLEDRFEHRRRNELSADWMLGINSILPQDKLILVTLRWNHRWTDKSGKPNKADGVAELVLHRVGGDLRIVQSRGGIF